jgi:hypothetical protein
MGPNVDPDQRLFVDWMAHLMRARLHLVDSYAAALDEGPLTDAQRREMASLRAVIRQVVRTLDELLDGGPGRIRPPP